MKDALLQQNTKGRILRVLVSLCVFAIVSISAFTVFEFGFADENDSKNLIYDISLHNDDGISGSSYGFASNPDVRPIEISAKGGQVNLRCVAWWGDGSTSTNNDIVGLTITSSDYNIAAIDGFTVTAVHDGEATLTVTVSEHTDTGEPIVLEVPVIITGQDKPYVESITISCDSIYYDEDSYKAMGYMLIDELTDLSGLYLDFYAIVEVKDPSDGTVVYYDSRDGLLSDLSDGNLADLSWCLTDSTMAEVSPYGQIHPTEYGNNNVWVVSSGGLDGYVFSGTMSYQIPNPEQSSGADGWGPQDTITFNVWYENDSEYSDNGNFTMPSDPNLVKTVTYDENDLAHVGTFVETYTLIAGTNLASVTAQGYGVDLENLLVQVCGLDPAQGTSAIQTLRFYDPSGAYKQMSASWLFQTRYYYPNIDIGSKAYAIAVRPMLAFDSWWQRGFPVNWDSPMSDSNRYRLLLGSTGLKETVTGFSWKWTNRIDVILESGQQTGDNKYIVNFDSQGGSEVSSQAVDIGGYANDPIAPEKNGYTFTGWYSNDGTLFDFNNTPITGNITLYAGWQEGEIAEPDETPHDPGSSGSESGGEPDTGDSDNSDNTGSTGNSGNSGNSGNDDVSDSIGAGTGGVGSSNGGSGSAGSLGGGAGNAEGTASGGTGGLLSDGTGTGGTGESLDAFYSSESSPDATEAGQSTSNDAGLGEGATEGTGSGLDETHEIGTGRYSLYQVMNPFTSDIGVEHEDNPLDPFVVPVSCGVVALGAVQSALWFAMQRRQTQLLAETGADAA